MKLPATKLKNDYIRQINLLIAELQSAVDSDTIDEEANHIQIKLDKLADLYQEKEELGQLRYKLYETQALLYYFQKRDADAIDFINQAIETHGKSYPKAERLLAKIGAAPSSPQNKVVFFHKSPITVGVLSFLTFNLYSLYWAYKHWRAIRLSTGVRTYPILSSIFQLFTSYPLFRKIRDSAKKAGYTSFRLAGIAAIGYLLLAFALNGIIGREAASSGEEITILLVSMAMSAGIAVILGTVQKAANFHNDAVLGKDHKHQTVFVGEVLFSSVGILLVAIIVVAGLYNAANDIYPIGTKEEISQQDAIITNLRAEYDTCSQDLKDREHTVDETSEFEVDSYNRDWDACEETRLELNKAVDEYNRLNGTPQSSQL